MYGINEDYKTPEGRDGKPLWNLQTFWLVLGKEARQGS